MNRGDLGFPSRPLPESTGPFLDHGPVGSTEEIDCSVFAAHLITLDTDVALSFRGAVPGQRCAFTLMAVQNNAGGSSVTVPASVTWLGSAPSWGISGGQVAGISEFSTYNGGANWYGEFKGAGVGGTGGGGGGGGGGTFDLTVLGTGGGNTRYMATNGSDSNAGSIGSPWATLQYSCSQLAPGDTLLIRGGTYVRHDAVTFTTSATAGSRILVKNYPGESVIFDGQNGGGNVVVPGAGVKYLVFDGLTFTRYYDSSGNGVFSFNGLNNIIVQRCTFIDNGNDSPNPHNDHSVYISNGNADILIRNCHMQGQRGAGVHCYGSGGSDRIQVVNCTMWDCYWGVLVGEGHDDVLVAQNTFYLIQSHAMSFGWGPGSVPSTNLKLYNNVCVMSGTPGSNANLGLNTNSRDAPGITTNYNCYYNASSSNVIEWSGTMYAVGAFRSASLGEANGIQANPLLDANYRLQSGSPAIDVASAAIGAAYPYDKDAKTRPVGSGYDMGAFEYG